MDSGWGRTWHRKEEKLGVSTGLAEGRRTTKASPFPVEQKPEINIFHCITHSMARERGVGGLCVQSPQAVLMVAL